LQNLPLPQRRAGLWEVSASKLQPRFDPLRARVRPTGEREASGLAALVAAGALIMVRITLIVACANNGNYHQQQLPAGCYEHIHPLHDTWRDVSHSVVVWTAFSTAAVCWRSLPACVHAFLVNNSVGFALSTALGIASTLMLAEVFLLLHRAGIVEAGPGTEYIDLSAMTSTRSLMVRRVSFRQPGGVRVQGFFLLMLAVVPGHAWWQTCCRIQEYSHPVLEEIGQGCRPCSC
jgi:hypothetical protein